MKDHEGRLVAIRFRPGLAVGAALEDAWAAGDAVLPIGPSTPDAQVGKILEGTRPAVLIETDGETTLPGAVPVSSDVALVVMTSGTHGRPKAVELTHKALTASVWGGLGRIGARHGERWLCVLPLHHIAGILVVVRSWELGTLPIIHPSFEPAAVAAEGGADYVSLVPTMLSRMLDEGVDLSHFRRILLGGAPAAPELLERAESAGANITVTYGMTETCGGCVYDGEPIDGVDLEIRDDGRIALRGEVVMRGYRNDPDLTERSIDDDWFITSDLGEWDDSGRLRVLGRTDEVVITGGNNVSVREVAAVLEQHPRVADATVEGRDDPDLGQSLVAICVWTDPADSVTLDDLQAFVADRLGRHAVPRELVVVEELEHTVMGEVARRFE